MDKKQERNITIGVVILVVLLVGAIGLPIVLSLPYSYTYTGIDGVDYNISVDRHTGKSIHIVSFWVNYQTRNKAPEFRKEYKVPFEYGPKELEYIPMDDTIRNTIFNKDKTKAIYITRNPSLDLETKGKMAVSILTIERITGRDISPAVFKIDTISAVTEKNELVQDVDISVITCGDSGKNGRTVILFERSNENKIYLDDNDCVHLEFVSDDDAIALATKLVYHLIGLM